MLPHQCLRSAARPDRLSLYLHRFFRLRLGPAFAFLVAGSSVAGLADDYIISPCGRPILCQTRLQKPLWADVQFHLLEVVCYRAF